MQQIYRSAAASLAGVQSSTLLCQPQAHLHSHQLIVEPIHCQPHVSLGAFAQALYEAVVVREANACRPEEGRVGGELA